MRVFDSSDSLPFHVHKLITGCFLGAMLKSSGSPYSSEFKGLCFYHCLDHVSILLV